MPGNGEMAAAVARNGGSIIEGQATCPSRSWYARFAPEWAVFRPESYVRFAQYLAQEQTNRIRPKPARSSYLVPRQHMSASAERANVPGVATAIGWTIHRVLQR